MKDNQLKNKQGGFLQIIIVIIIIVLILSYFHINIGTVVDYVRNAFHNVFG
jgi:flagellar basal body-associated protein FliL